MTLTVGIRFDTTQTNCLLKKLKFFIKKRTALETEHHFQRKDVNL
jgi:hypothetical protein